MLSGLRRFFGFDSGEEDELEPSLTTTLSSGSQPGAFRVGEKLSIKGEIVGEGDLELIEAHLQPGSPAIGRSVRQLELPEGCALLGIVRAGLAVAVGSDTPLREGDKVIAIGRPECETALHRQLIGSDSPGDGLV